MKIIVYLIIITNLLCGCGVNKEVENQRKFSKGDSIIIKHLNIEGVVWENCGYNRGHRYCINYKDNKGIIKTIILSESLIKKNEK